MFFINNISRVGFLMKKKILLAVVLILAVAAVVTAVVLGPKFFKDGQKTDESENVSESAKFGFEALKINGEYISADVFNEEYRLFYEKYKNNGEMIQKTDEERYDILLDEITNKFVLEDYFENKANVKVSDEEVEDYVAKYVKPRYSNSEEQSAYFQRMGFADEVDMKKNIEDYLIKQQVYFDAATKYGITLTGEESNEAYQIHKQHNIKVDIKNILIAINDSRTKEQAEEIAKNVYSKLKEGESFEELVLQYSEDSESKENGGKKENVTQGYNGADFDKVVFSAKEGQLLEPIYLTKGYEIIYIQKVRDFTHPQEEYSETVLVEKFLNSEKYDEWLESIKKDYQIEITAPQYKAFRAYKNKNYEEAGLLYQQAYEKTKDPTYIDRACETYSLAENWAELIKVSQIGYKARPENVLYYIHEAKGVYKSGNQEEGLKKMQAATSKAKDSVYNLGVIRNTYEELGLSEEAEKINLQ